MALSHDFRHLKEDMGSMADQLDFSKMTEQEIEFHYFQYVRDNANPCLLNRSRIANIIT